MVYSFLILTIYPQDRRPHLTEQKTEATRAPLPAVSYHVPFLQQPWASGRCQDGEALLRFTPSLSLQTSKDQKQGSWSLLGASGELGRQDMGADLEDPAITNMAALQKQIRHTTKSVLALGWGHLETLIGSPPWFLLSAVATQARLAPPYGFQVCLFETSRGPGSPCSSFWP